MPNFNESIKHMTIENNDHSATQSSKDNANRAKENIDERGIATQPNFKPANRQNDLEFVDKRIEREYEQEEEHFIDKENVKELNSSRDYYFQNLEDEND